MNIIYHEEELEETLAHKDSGLFPPQSSSASSSSSVPTPDVPRASPDLSKNNKDRAPNSASPYTFLPQETPWSSVGDISIGLPSLFATPEPRHDTISPNASPPDPFMELLFSAWPSRLPPPQLLDHLVEVFLTSHPYAPYVLHRPTFLYNLSLGPRSPHFPPSCLLHSICAVASLYSTAIAQLPDTVAKPPKGIFTADRRMDNECFGTQQAKFAQEAQHEALPLGRHLFELYQCQLAFLLTWILRLMRLFSLFSYTYPYMVCIHLYDFVIPRLT